MILSRTKTYFLLLGLFIGICLLYQGIWLISSTAKGDILSFGHGSGRGYRSIENVEVNYTVHDVMYDVFFLRSGTPKYDSTVQIRYLLFAPSWSRINTFAGNWGLVLVTSAVFFSILTVVFLQKQIIPYSAQFIFGKKFPFLKQKNPENI